MASTGGRGRPMRFPCARATAVPERTRSRISSRSNSAIPELHVLEVSSAGIFSFRRLLVQIPHVAVPPRNSDGTKNRVIRS
jgi:hypothetical protein